MAQSLQFNSAVTNRLLEGLPPQELEALLPHLETVSLNSRQILYEPDKPISGIYFPLDAVVALQMVMRDGERVTVGMAGKEGIVGLPLFLGAGSMPGQALVQVAGQAFRLSREVFQAEIMTGKTGLAGRLKSYTNYFLNQVAQLAACHSRHPVERRYACWLLMTCDRVGRNEFSLSQELMGLMLGVRRSSVNETATKLQRNGLIRYRWSAITIIDRAVLETVACPCYQTYQNDFYNLYI